MLLKAMARLRPYSHQCGAQCLIPYSGWSVCAFPSKLVLTSFIDGSEIEVLLSFEGPVDQFTLQLGIEEGCVRVFGMSKRGYFRYFLKQEQQGLSLTLDRLPSCGVEVCFSGLIETFHSGGKIFLSTKKFLAFFPSLERLSLGIHKACNIENIKKRQDLKEILPLWLAIGLKVPRSSCTSGEDFAEKTLDELERCIQGGDAIASAKILTTLFAIGMQGIFTPRMVDREYQGITTSALFTSLSASLQLLSRGALAIRSMFFQSRGEEMAILPCLPKGFVCGVYTGLKTEQGHQVDIVWSKGRLRTAVITPAFLGAIKLTLDKNIKRFRLRLHRKDRGVVIAATEPVVLASLRPILLDRFES